MPARTPRKSSGTPATGLTVKSVARLSGVPAATLRAWERRYDAVKPARSGSGRREYSMREVERLRILGALVERGHAIGGIANLSDPALRKLLDAAGGPELTESVRRGLTRYAEVLDRRIDDALAAVIAALDRFDLPALEDELQAARVTSELRPFIFRLLVPLLIEVGLRGDRGTISIAQEHGLSAILRSQLGQSLRELLARAPRRGRGVALATPAGDLHEFGILIAALLVADHGLPVHYLGCNLPPEEFAAACRRLNAGVAALGTSPVPASELKLPLDEYLRRLDRELPRGCALWLGGPGRLDLASLSLRGSFRPLGTLEAFDRALDEYRRAEGTPA